MLFDSTYTRLLDYSNELKPKVEWWLLGAGEKRVLVLQMTSFGDGNSCNTM